MNRTVLFATCRKQAALTASDELVARHLRAEGVPVVAAPWDTIAPGTLSDTIVCLRSTWDYHLRSDEFREWISALHDLGVALVNPAETILWNMDKKYLRWLEMHGVAIPATIWIAPGDAIDVPDLLAAAGWESAVLKPRVSATAHGTHLVTPGTVIDEVQRHALALSGALLQAFISEIQTGGEVSLVFIDGGFSHAVRKQPSPGDFRVQHEFGGTAQPVPVSPALRDFGAHVLDIIPVRWTYARVDVVDTQNGPVLMELELIEPDLFFGTGDNGAARLGDALRRTARTP